MKPCLAATTFALMLSLAAQSFSALDAQEPSADDKEDRAGISISAGERLENGVWRHTIRSPYQSAETELRVLTPDDVDRTRRYPLVYVLPVEGHGKSRYGDGLEEVLRHDLHNKHQAIFAAPSFSALPWYADHPEKPELRQETYLLQAVVPFVDKTYPVKAERDGRLLLGFSKSGWGAWSLLMRHPDVFGRAAAWDAPLMMETVGKYGNGEIIGTQENFEQYRIADLLAKGKDELAAKPRLILTGYGSFREHHQRAAKLCTQLKIPLVYRDGPQRKHDWHSGWVAEAVELLLP